MAKIAGELGQILAHIIKCRGWSLLVKLTMKAIKLRPVFCSFGLCQLFRDSTQIVKDYLNVPI